MTTQLPDGSTLVSEVVITANPKYPDVPADADGVPPILGDGGEDASDLMTGDDTGLDLSGQWGVFTVEGAPALDFDTMGAFEARKSYRISSFPIEQGQFGSYNKVETPGEYRVPLVMGRTLADRTRFLQDVEALVDSITLYTIATPERTYPSVNPTDYDFSRTTQGGVSMITVDLAFEEVRSTVVSQYTNTKMPDAAAAVDGGPVLARDPTAAEVPPIDASLDGSPGFLS